MFFFHVFPLEYLSCSQPAITEDYNLYNLPTGSLHTWVEDNWVQIHYHTLKAKRTGFLLCSVLIHFSFSIFSALIIHFGGERTLNEFGQIRLYLLFPFWSSTSELLQKIELKILFGHTYACTYESASMFMYTGKKVTLK